MREDIRDLRTLRDPAPPILTDREREALARAIRRYGGMDPDDYEDAMVRERGGGWRERRR